MSYCFTQNTKACQCCFKFLDRFERLVCVLQAICQLVREKLSKEALEKQSQKTTTTHDKLSLDTLDMGFNTGGKIIIIPLLQVVVCTCVCARDTY